MSNHRIVKVYEVIGDVTIKEAEAAIEQYERYTDYLETPTYLATVNRGYGDNKKEVETTVQLVSKQSNYIPEDLNF